MNDLDWKNLIYRADYILFQNEYKKFVSAMDSRKFAEMMIRYEGELTRIKIVLEMVNNKINVPCRLYEQCVVRNSELEINYIRDFFEEKKIYSNEDLAKFNIDKIYHEFKYYLKWNCGMSCNLSSMRDLREYFNNLTLIEEKIKSLDDITCVLMKMDHI